MVSRSELLLISFCCLYGKTQKFTVPKILISMGRAILYNNLDIITVTYSCTITYNWSLIIGVYPFPQMYHIIMYPYVYVIGCLLAWYIYLYQKLSLTTEPIWLSFTMLHWRLITILKEGSPHFLDKITLKNLFYVFSMTKIKIRGWGSNSPLCIYF